MTKISHYLKISTFFAPLRELKTKKFEIMCMRKVIIIEIRL